jgi:hypothetical protein
MKKLAVFLSLLAMVTHLPAPTDVEYPGLGVPDSGSSALLLVVALAGIGLMKMIGNRLSRPRA